MLGPDASAAVHLDRVISYELEILGSHGMAAVDYPAMLDLVTSGRLDPAALVGRTISLDEAGDALMAMDGPTSSGLTVIAF